MLTLLAQFGDEGLQPSNAPFRVEGTENPGSAAATASALDQLEKVISQIIGLLTVTASLFFIVYFVIGAFKWVVAGGESAKVQKARDQMIQGVLGLIILVSTYSVVGVLSTALGLDILNPGDQLRTVLQLEEGATNPVPNSGGTAEEAN